MSHLEFSSVGCIWHAVTSHEKDLRICSVLSSKDLLKNKRLLSPCPRISLVFTKIPRCVSRGRYTHILFFLRSDLFSFVQRFLRRDSEDENEGSDEQFSANSNSYQVPLDL